jgi:hypothetical protein
MPASAALGSGMGKGNVLITDSIGCGHGNYKRLQHKRFITFVVDRGKDALSVGSRVLTVRT